MLLNYMHNQIKIYIFINILEILTTKTTQEKLKKAFLNMLAYL